MKRLLDEIPRLKSLAYNPKNAELRTWDERVKSIIKEAFGSDSKEYTRYDGVVLLKHVNTQEEREQAYVDYVSQRETALKDIIKEHEIPTKMEGYTSDRGISKSELELFYDSFIRYRELALKKQRERLTHVEESEFQTLSKQLQRKYGKLQKVINEYGGSSELLLEGGAYKCEALSSAFDYTMFGPGALEAVLDKAVATINMAIGKLEEPLELEQVQKGDIFPSGKTYDAYESIKKILSTAKKNIMIVDPWVDGTLFTLLSNAQPSVHIQILTENMQGDFKLAGQKFKKQHGALEVRKNNKFHDRFILADDKIIHIGASIKDAGNKMFALGEFEGSEIKSKMSEIISGYWNEAEIIL